MAISIKYKFFLVCILSALLVSPTTMADVKKKSPQTGMASWYGIKFQGRSTSSGERYDRHKLTAAHKTLPLQTIVRVTNLQNNESVIVRINDRGPFVGQRIIDLSEAAAKEVKYRAQGLALVKVEVLRYPDGSKQRQALIATMTKIRAQEQERQRNVFFKPEINRRAARAYLVRQPAPFFTLSALPATALASPAFDAPGADFLNSLPVMMLETDDSVEAVLQPAGPLFSSRGEPLRNRSVYVRKGLFQLMRQSPTAYV